MANYSQDIVQRIVNVAWSPERWWYFGLVGITDSTEQAVNVYVRDSTDPGNDSIRNRIYEAPGLFDIGALPVFPATIAALQSALNGGVRVFQGAAPWDITGSSACVLYPVGQNVKLRAVPYAGTLEMWGEAFVTRSPPPNFVINYHFDSPTVTVASLVASGALNPFDPALWN